MDSEEKVVETGEYFTAEHFRDTTGLELSVWYAEVGAGRNGVVYRRAKLGTMSFKTTFIVEKIEGNGVCKKEQLSIETEDYKLWGTSVSDSVTIMNLDLTSLSS